ncbi:ABC-type transport auxiliary lipoprotein family protein [Falsiroseomonas selenitidurans]|uniref:ABC-type transport auxiliary lipoprotein component domain-containing protein n=1 Tax=Falsiroseomonas selenitidurans TaxID=2716335 RepID=A0ABX1E2L0_9PROT|nr:ABC-type transport auxiliary lipoprotein family protein [Falsiroseomonas selenitidurans]NKC31003.1 hypothetical protein [Falsiroseomonas selenitidurans]
MNRRALLLPALAAGLAGCSLFPSVPNVPVRRYALAPRRPFAVEGRGPVLLVRRMRALPGLMDLGLRRLKADGSYDLLVYEEWLAPPADLADAALRAWLQASGLFSAVVPQGSRAEAGFVLELQLTALEAVPALGEARAGLAGVLLREERLASRVVDSLQVQASAPMAPQAEAPAMAAAMTTALGLAFGRLEAALAPLVR